MIQLTPDFIFKHIFIDLLILYTYFIVLSIIFIKDNLCAFHTLAGLVVLYSLTKYVLRQNTSPVLDNLTEFVSTDYCYTILTTLGISGLPLSTMRLFGLYNSFFVFNIWFCPLHKQHYCFLTICRLALNLGDKT